MYVYSNNSFYSSITYNFIQYTNFKNFQTDPSIFKFEKMLSLIRLIDDQSHIY